MGGNERILDWRGAGPNLSLISYYHYQTLHEKPKEYLATYFSVA